MVAGAPMPAARPTTTLLLFRLRYCAHERLARGSRVAMNATVQDNAGENAYGLVIGSDGKSLRLIARAQLI